VGATLVKHKRNEEILEELKVEPAEEKLGSSNKLATTCIKNEQQNDAKNNAE
jgi:hypothetical protein